MLAAEEVYGDLAFTGRRTPPFGLPYVAINMVCTLDGRVSVGGKASPIGSRVDRLIMRNIRRAVDAVLVGAGTARAEEMNLTVPEGHARRRKANGLSEQPLGVILAGSGQLPLQRKLFSSRAQPIVVVAGAATPEETLREASKLDVRILRVEGSDYPEPRKVLRLLKERLNVSSVLLEGGPTVNGSFVSQGVVDELFLTLSPKLLGSRADALTIASTVGDEQHATDFGLISVHASAREGELYLRYANSARRECRASSDSVSDK